MPIPEDNQGRSLRPVFKHDGVATSRHKLFHLPRTKEWQLFDLQTDPREKRSLHDDPASAGLLAEMKALYQEMHTYYKVP